MPPDLEERFLEPPGWRWDFFERAGRRIRFGAVVPENGAAEASVICLPGLSEFGEKYFETARWALAHNMEFYVIDWMGQGGAGRYLANPHKRHSAGFEEDTADLEFFIKQYVRGPGPLAMLAHSMGAHTGLHVLHRNPGLFACAALTAPMLGLRAFRNMPGLLALALTRAVQSKAGESYAVGGGDWRQELRPFPGRDAFSGDPVRGAVHNAWCLAYPALQVGRITYGWLYEAVKSCVILQKPETLRAIHTPCLIGLAGHEEFVDNRAIRRAVRLLPEARLLEFPGSRHEILMERDEIRTPFLESFYQLVKERSSAPPAP